MSKQLLTVSKVFKMLLWSHLIFQTQADCFRFFQFTSSSEMGPGRIRGRFDDTCTGIQVQPTTWWKCIKNLVILGLLWRQFMSDTGLEPEAWIYASGTYRSTLKYVLCSFVVLSNKIHFHFTLKIIIIKFKLVTPTLCLNNSLWLLKYLLKRIIIWFFPVVVPIVITFSPVGALGPN